MLAAAPGFAEHLLLVDPNADPQPGADPLEDATTERHAVEAKSTLWIFAGRLPGAFLGVALLKLLPGAKLDVLMSLMVLLGVVLVVSRGSFRRTSAREFGAGLASGTMAMVSSMTTSQESKVLLFNVG